jgi:glycosyltransferase involved in cell wall biosynthesis
MGETTISVAVPTSGRPAMLRRALASILAQTRLPNEIVISEDGADAET